MNLYLSSDRVGNDRECLSELIGGSRRVAVIRNSLDFSTDQNRLDAGLEREFRDLDSLNLNPEELDLRAYFGEVERLREKLLSFDAIWAVGGNAFILRRAMRQSGLENILRDGSLPHTFTYAGYSAGACVVAGSLRGIHLVDPPEVVPEGYDSEPIWEGLGLVPFAIAPHYDSDHPETDLINKTIEFFKEHGIEYVTLRDGEAYVKRH